MKTFYLAVFSAFLGTAYAQEENNACLATAAQSLVACNSEADTAKELQLAICENSADRATCITDAESEQAAAKVECESQDVAQKAACEKLGPAAYDPQIDPANFVSTVTNPYFPLTPGTTYIYEGESEEGTVRVEKTVTENTKEIMGVTCIEVHDVEKINDEIVEDTLDWFAQDTEGNVWYFGENSKEIEDDQVISLEGSFTAGEDGAKPGIIMKAQPQVGDVYRQEFALREAEDVGEVLSITESVTVPTGTYSDVVKTNDTSALEPDDVENKFYAKGVGVVSETNVTTGETLELQSITPAPTPTPEEQTPTPPTSFLSSGKPVRIK